MKEKTFEAPLGTIHYWRNDVVSPDKTLGFLPELTADHHLFDRQIKAFDKQYDLLVWGAPGHASSRDFRLDFSLMDEAEWLHAILKKEGICEKLQSPMGRKRRS